LGNPLKEVVEAGGGCGGWWRLKRRLWRLVEVMEVGGGCMVRGATSSNLHNLPNLPNLPKVH